MNPSHCSIHDTDEEVDEEAWEVCHECGHVYNSKQEFVDAYNELKPADVKGITLAQADSIGFCQFCLHDFII